MTIKNPKKPTPTPTPAVEPIISITKIDAGRLLVPIRGTAPLIMNNWSAKAKMEMLASFQGKAIPKTPKDPEAEYQSAFYLLDPSDAAGSQGGSERYGMPVTSFKAATVEAARFYPKNVSMVSLRQFLFFRGEYSKVAKQQLVEIWGDPIMREDPVTVGRGGHDLRYRPEFWPWKTTVDVTYAKNSIDKESVLSLIDAGGMGIGVGEWRPEKSGVMGTYEIDPTRQVEAID